MNCPRCGSALTEMERHGVVLDICSSCGGMWLDKGELASILKHVREAEASLDAELRAGSERVPGPARYERLPREEHYDYRRNEEHHHEEHHDQGHGYGYEHRKKTGLQKLFDIFD